MLTCSYWYMYNVYISNIDVVAIYTSYYIQPLHCRWLYWSDLGDPVQIQRASMDGQSVETIQSSATSIMEPYALTMDYDGQILYWADAYYDTISWSKAEPGSEITTIIANAMSVIFPYSMVTLGGYLFLTDLDSGVTSLDATNGNSNTSIIDRRHFCNRYCHPDDNSCWQNPYGIEIISEQRQAQSE